MRIYIFIDSFTSVIHQLTIKNMRNVNYAIDSYRDNQLSEHLERMEEEEPRVCTQCDKEIIEGSLYVIRDGEEHFCSDDCLTHNYSGEEYLKMYENDVAYYTEVE